MVGFRFGERPRSIVKTSNLIVISVPVQENGEIICSEMIYIGKPSFSLRVPWPLIHKIFDLMVCKNWLCGITYARMLCRSTGICSCEPDNVTVII